MATERGRRLPKFGEYLKSLREGRWSQRALAEAVRDRAGTAVSISQALVAQYEAGTVVDPDPSTLAALAEVLGVDPMGLVLRLVKEKYDPVGAWEAGLAKARWGILEAALDQADGIGEQADTDGVPRVPAVGGFAEDQLRAKAEIVRRGEFLSVKALTRWEQQVAGVTEFRVLAPDFLAFADQGIQDTVVANLSRGVRYVYYVGAAAGGHFADYLEKLRPKLPPAKRRDLARLVCQVPVDEQSLRWLLTDHLVAIPGSLELAIVYRYIRLGEKLYAYRLSPIDVRRLIERWQTWGVEPRSPARNRR